jgi:hypothetical protein
MIMIVEHTKQIPAAFYTCNGTRDAAHRKAARLGLMRYSLFEARCVSYVIKDGRKSIKRRP